MRRILQLSAAGAVALMLLLGADAMAQSRNSGGSRSTTSSSSSTRSSGSTSSSSATRSSSSNKQSGSTSSSSTRSSSSSSTRQSGSTSRNSGSSAQSGSTRNSGSASSSSSSSSVRSGSSSSQSGSTRNSGSSSSSSSSSVRNGSSSSQSGSSSSTRSSQSGSTRSSGSSTRSGSSSSSSSTRSSSSSTRSSGTTTRSGSSSSSAVRSGSSASSAATQSGSSSSASRSSSVDRNKAGVSVVSSGDGTVRSNSNVTKNGLGSSNGKDAAPADGGYKKDQYGNYRDNDGNYRYGDGWGYRMDDHGRDLHRIPPRERDFMPYHRPGSFYANAPHYFGYRVSYLPSSRYVSVYTRFGVTYYIYNGVYYRPWGDCYVVVRPPFGVVLDRAVSYYDFRPIRFSYYSNYYRAYDAIYDNIAYIAEQNRIIAQNNATIAAQNAAIALNSNRALSSYNLANRLGLVQSYAYADRNYYYQDGVFYIVNGNGRYEVIVPPAGALVSSLPDDYDTITIGDVEVYRVDDTVYRLVLVDGQPCLEVLGQMYGNLASRYNIY